MKNSIISALPFQELLAEPYSFGSVILNKSIVINILDELTKTENINSLKVSINHLYSIISNKSKDDQGLINIDTNGDTIVLDKKIILSELQQIRDSQSIGRAKYYTNRLKKGIETIRTSNVNDINLNRWKEYEEILTDSLWIMDKRDSSGAHLGWYWGNFIPQIPNQMMLRYTKKGEWVLDTFVGSGTTLIECRRLGRNGIGIEINPEVSQKAQELIDKEINTENISTEIITGDCRKIDYKKILKAIGINQVQLVIMHPPYHDIIKFSNIDGDLSNCKSANYFIKEFGESVSHVTPFLNNNRYLCLVIGDKYSKGEWIPLGFQCMNEVLKYGYTLKSIIVKNFVETRGKRNQHELWRYRALVGGFYIFKHEYIMLFKKK